MDKQASDLVERLEAAEAGSRELDRLVALTSDPRFSGWTCHPALSADSPDFMRGEVIEDEADFRRWLFDDDSDGGPVSVPAVTTSLDAALALAERVLPGAEISMVHSPGGSFPYADVWVHKRSGQCHAKTPALALCIAILKARASNPVNEGGGGD